MSTADRSASAAMVRQIIRRVNMRDGLPPKQQPWTNVGYGTFMKFVAWRNAVATRNIALPKNTGSCSC